MSPFRSLFVGLNRIPPLAVFVVIGVIGLCLAMWLSGIINEKQHELDLVKQASVEKAGQKTKVVYTTKNIDEGDYISQDALVEQDLENSKVPPDAFTSVNDVIGKQAAYPITAQTLMCTHAIKPAMVQTGFEGKIKEGMRALTFGVDANSGVAGFIMPGSHVDILGITGSSGDTKAAPVMSDVEVIAVGSTYTKAPGGATTANAAGSVTVAVTPENALKLVKAVSAAKLWLVLRNEKDSTPVAVVDVKDLFPKHQDSTEVASLPAPPLPPPPLPGTADNGGAQAANAPPPPPPMHEIEMWSGSKKEVLSVPQG